MEVVRTYAVTGCQQPAAKPRFNPVETVASGRFCGLMRGGGGSEGKLRGRVVRIRFSPVERMDFPRPRLVCHIGPVVLIESRCIFEAVLLHVQHEAFILRVERQRVPRRCEKLFAHTEEASEGQHCVTHFAAAHVQHDFLDVTQILVFTSASLP